MPLTFPENFKEFEPKRISVIPELIFKDENRAPALDEVREIINGLFFRSCHSLMDL